METEHAIRVVEAVLATFATCKFAHECYEVGHHLLKIISKLKGR